MVASASLSMRNDLRELTSLQEKAEEFLRGAGAGGAVVYRTGLIIEEMVTNIVKYGLPKGQEGLIKVLLEVTEDEVIIRFVDRGCEFDPLCWPDPELPDSILDCPVGGLGIHLVRKMACRMEYHRNGPENVLTIAVSTALP